MTSDTAFQRFRDERRARRAEERAQGIRDLLAFANQDLPNTPEAQRAAAALLESLHRRAWFNDSRVIPRNRRERRPHASATFVQQVHRELQRALRALFPVDDHRHWERRVWRPPLRGQHRQLVMHYHRRVMSMTEAGWPDTVWMTLMSWFEEYGSRIRHCAVCAERRLFIKERRQQYCSKRCSQRARSARWYRRHHEEALERRHERYVRQVLKGRRGRVGRRPRRPQRRSSST